MYPFILELFWYSSSVIAGSKVFQKIIIKKIYQVLLYEAIYHLPFSLYTGQIQRNRCPMTRLVLLHWQ